jgi:galactonate dehydratase
MKITRVETFIAGLDRRNSMFVRIQTDEGIHGIGEAYSCGPDEATAAVVADFETWLVGKDPRDVEALWHLMYAGSRFPGGSS